MLVEGDQSQTNPGPWPPPLVLGGHSQASLSLQPTTATTPPERSVTAPSMPPSAYRPVPDRGDIVAAVNLVRAAGFPCGPGGGHSVAGLSLCDDGVVIDLSLMRKVMVDPQRRIAIVEPGATWVGYDAATATHGLASTGGLISTTGVAGLTLGGGIGWLQRKHGPACDNLVAAEVITADGSTVRASSQENPDLLWGLHGGGGNFGIVSRFELSLHPVSTVLGGLMLFSLDDGHRSAPRVP